MKYIQAYGHLLIALFAKGVYLITLPILKLNDFLLDRVQKFNNRQK